MASAGVVLRWVRSLRLKRLNGVNGRNENYEENQEAGRASFQTDTSVVHRLSFAEELKQCGVGEWHARRRRAVG
jgi:hypothetical protein